MTSQSETRRSRPSPARAAVCAAHAGERAEKIALDWRDPETGEEFRVEVHGTQDWLERLLAAGFVPCEGDPSGEGLAPNRLAAAGAPPVSALGRDGNRTGVPRVGPVAGPPGGTPSSIAG